MIKHYIRIGALVGASTLLLASAASAFPGEKQYGKLAKVSLATAEAAALKAYPGKVVAYELEKEKGGSGLRYAIVIASGKVKHEVGVDASTGKVLENVREDKDTD